MKSLLDIRTDIIYIVGPHENKDLLYSLRSIAKHLPDHRVFISGYKPEWVNDNVGHIKVNQPAHISKYKNVRYNLLGLCACDELSENIILMNDDFILTRPVQDSLNTALGTIDDKILEYKQTSNNTDYTRAFAAIRELFNELGVSSYNYESHRPMVINRKKFIELLSIPKVQRFISKNNVLLYRSLYGNYYGLGFDSIEPDVKIRQDTDSFNTDWISLSDNCLDCAKELFTKLNNYLQGKFPDKCKYEMP